MKKLNVLAAASLDAQYDLFADITMQLNRAGLLLTKKPSKLLYCYGTIATSIIAEGGSIFGHFETLPDGTLKRKTDISVFVTVPRDLGLTDPSKDDDVASIICNCMSKMLQHEVGNTGTVYGYHMKERRNDK